MQVKIYAVGLAADPELAASWSKVSAWRWQDDVIQRRLGESSDSWEARLK